MQLFNLSKIEPNKEKNKKRNKYFFANTSRKSVDLLITKKTPFSVRMDSFVFSKRGSGIFNCLLKTEVALQKCFRKRCSENMQQIYRRALMPKCDFIKSAKQF